MESMTEVCLLRDFAGCRWQAKRQLQAMVKLVTQGQGVMLRAASTLVLCWLWIN